MSSLLERFLCPFCFNWLAKKIRMKYTMGRIFGDGKKITYCVWRDELRLALLIIGEEESLQAFNVLMVRNTERFKDGFYLHPIALSAGDSVHKFSYLVFDQKSRLVTEQGEHSLYFWAHITKKRLHIILLRRVNNSLFAEGLGLNTGFLEGCVNSLFIWGIPVQPELLLMDDFVCLQN